MLKNNVMQANWAYWETGILAAIAATVTTPIEAPVYLPLAVVCLLFTWGFVRS